VSDKKHTTLNPQGWGFLIEGGHTIKEVETRKCVHCGGHFHVSPGSGRIRGWCVNCAGPVCGPQCAECVPEEQLLENLEKGMSLEEARKHKPIRVSTGGIILGS
jgi:hypothetical protein